MSQKKDELAQIARLSAASIMMACIDRVKEQETDAYRVLEDLETITTAAKLNTLGRAIVNTAGNSKTNKMLIYKIKKLRTQLNRRYQVPELTLKLLNEVTMEYQTAIGGHFGKWENILQAVTIEILEKTHILSDRSIIPENLSNLLKNIKNKSEDENY